MRSWVLFKSCEECWYFKFYLGNNLVRFSLQVLTCLLWVQCQFSFQNLAVPFRSVPETWKMVSLFCSHTHQYCIMNNFMGSLSGASSWYFPVPWESSFLVLWPESWGFSYPFCCILHDGAFVWAKWQEDTEKKVMGFDPTLAGPQLHWWERRCLFLRTLTPMSSHCGSPQDHLGFGVWEERNEKRRWTVFWALGVPFPVPWARIRGLLDCSVFVPQWALPCCPWWFWWGRMVDSSPVQWFLK